MENALSGIRAGFKNRPECVKKVPYNLGPGLDWCLLESYFLKNSAMTAPQHPDKLGSDVDESLLTLINPLERGRGAEVIVIGKVC